MRKCAYVECGAEFVASTHNQKFCNEDCCRRATNARLMDQYYERKARRQGQVRVCTTPGCSTRLSRYNEQSVCQKCEAAVEHENRQKLLRMLVA